MGFFSSQRANVHAVSSEPAPVTVLRSRFYGSKPPIPRAPTPQPPPLRSRSPLAIDPDPSPNPTPNQPVPSTSRSAADPVTMTLAQRLNELANANANGLLDDHEYRLLRQSLFERFASSSQMPAEIPVVPVMSKPRASSRPRTSTTSSRPPSNFQVDLDVKRKSSGSSIKSSMADLLRRVSSRQSRTSSSVAPSDSASVLSVDTRASSVRQRSVVARQPSDASLRTQNSALSHPFTRSFPNDAAMASTHSISRGTTRSGKGPSAPPSAFSPHLAGLGSTPRLDNIDALLDDDELPAADIRNEIALLEVEAKRLTDAFNGLELSSLTKNQQRTGSRKQSSPLGDGTRPSIATSRRPTNSSSENGHGLPRDSDTFSVQSKFSFRADPKLASSSGSLSRKGSLSTLGSRRPGADNLQPPVPPLPYIPSPTSSRVNLPSPSENVNGNKSSTSSLSVSTAAKSRRDMDRGVIREELSTDAETSDIKRRRIEVADKYDRRLEFLRAKLKSAEMREALRK